MGCLQQSTRPVSKFAVSIIVISGGYENYFCTIIFLYYIYKFLLFFLVNMLHFDVVVRMNLITFIKFIKNLLMPKR